MKFVKQYSLRSRIYAQIKTNEKKKEKKRKKKNRK